MAEYIDREELSVTPIDITDLPTDKCLMVYLAEDVDSLPTADVIERAQYNRVLELIAYLCEEHDKRVTEYNNLRSKIDKSIEWILHYATMQANPYKKEGMRRALQLLKEKIGE